METLGDKIKLLRNKLTQEELAAILKVERSTLASWEVNRREPDIATLRRIATHFRVSIDWLVGHVPSQPTAFPAAQVQETTADYSILLDSDWRKVVETAKGYGIEPETVCQLIEANAKIALSLQRNTSK
ncbi:hypothetical protein SRRS_43860 [Sporomusa rhizae]|uniref:helix-turn-helix domain-containing protein n=1 Tax=Sporomusa rhizae TaxID=357999 RepID=UPI00352A1E54